MTGTRLIHMRDLLFDRTVCGHVIMPLSKMLVVKQNWTAVTCRGCLRSQDQHFSQPEDK